MKQRENKAVCLGLLTAFALTFASPAALAEKPDWAGGGGGHKQKQGKGGDDGGHKGGKQKHARQEQREVRVGSYFHDADRRAAREYYGERYSSGHCPPGLAKKNNGCMPPGQAKKYAVGQPLPTTVVYYPVPQPVLIKLPPPPTGHKYVRVAADILLIAVGTSMVVDAITDLTRL